MMLRRLPHDFRASLVSKTFTKYLRRLRQMRDEADVRTGIGLAKLPQAATSVGD